MRICRSRAVFKRKEMKPLSRIEYGAPETDELERSRRRAYLRKKRRVRRQRRRLIGALAVLLAVTLVSVCVLAVLMLRSGRTNETAASQSGYQVNGAAAENDFSEIYYYEAEKAARYDDYKRLHPELDDGDVVWMVNANLDKPQYGYDIPTDSYDDPYIIVNKYYKVPEDYRPDDLVSVDGYEMRRDTGEAYKKMKRAAADEGKRIRVVSAYRSVEYQRGLYNRYLSTDSKANVDRYSARPGYSEHHTGMALDLFGSVDGLRSFVNTPEYEWVKENCWKYGFIIRYTTDIESITGYENEPWHIRYVGTEVSTDMREKGIASFEEYHVKYIEHGNGER